MFISANDTLAPEFALVESQKRSIFTKMHFEIIYLTDKKLASNLSEKYTIKYVLPCLLLEWIYYNNTEVERQHLTMMSFFSFIGPLVYLRQLSLSTNLISDKLFRNKTLGRNLILNHCKYGNVVIELNSSLISLISFAY